MFVFLLFISSSAFSNIIQDDVSTTSKTNFSFSSVCQKMVKHESPLIEVVSGTKLDCMGKTVDVGDFCEKELAADPYYLRGYVNPSTKEVVCHSGKKVIFKFQCVKIKDKKFCASSAKESCVQIRARLARRLDIVHSSFTKNEKGIKELNCYFESLPLKESPSGGL